jgi:hypothetical protein
MNKTLESQARKTIEVWVGRVSELAVDYTKSTADHFSPTSIDVEHNLERLLDLKLSKKDRGIVEAVINLVQRRVIDRDLVSLYFSNANRFL